MTDFMNSPCNKHYLCHWFLPLLAVLLATAFASTATASPFEASNCQLSAPPENSGDDIIFGNIAKIYPRLKDFPWFYTGCQTVWFQTGDENWEIHAIAYFESGTARSYWTPPPEEMLCEYQSGRLLTSPAQACPPYTALRTLSAAPGCVKTSLSRGDTTGCRYE